MIQQRIINASGAPENAGVHYRKAPRHPREIIEELRTARGFRSPRALAMAAGISQPTLSRYLKGDSDNMEMESWQALARMLHVTLSELLGEVPLQSSVTAGEMVKLLDLMDEDQQKALLAAARAFAEMPKRGEH